MALGKKNMNFHPVLFETDVFPTKYIVPTGYVYLVYRRLLAHIYIIYSID